MVPPSPLCPSDIASQEYWMVTRMIRVQMIIETIPTRFSKVGATSRKMTVRV